MEPKNILKASKFLEWYFSSDDDIKPIAYRVIEELKMFGKCNTTVEELFDECGYIPKFICENKDEDAYNYDIEDVKFINDLNK
jgi:hypothetical protein